MKIYSNSRRNISNFTKAPGTSPRASTPSIGRPYVIERLRLKSIQKGPTTSRFRQRGSKEHRKNVQWEPARRWDGAREIIRNRTEPACPGALLATEQRVAGVARWHLLAPPRRASEQRGQIVLSGFFFHATCTDQTALSSFAPTTSKRP